MKDWWEDAPLAEEEGRERAWWEDIPEAKGETGNRVGAPDVPEDEPISKLPSEGITPPAMPMISAQSETQVAPRIEPELPEETEAELEATPQGPTPAQNPDTTDDARARRGFGRSAYMDGLVDAPQIPGVGERPGMIRPDERVERPRQPVSDLGKRTARGATEVAASIPEAMAILGRAITDSSYPSIRDAVPALTQERVDLMRRIDQFGEESPEGRAAQMRLTNVEGEIMRAARMVTEREQLMSKPISEGNLYGLGDQVRGASLELFGTPDPQFDERFISKLSEGAGSMAGFVGVTILTGLGGGAAAGSSLNASGMYRRALADGATEEQAKTAAYIGSIVGASEVVPIGRAFDMLPSEARGRVANAIGQRLSNAFMTAGEEGAQEAFVEIANNLTEKGIWNPDQKVFEGVTESALIGAILGGGVGAVAPTPSRQDRERLDSPRLTEADRASPIPNDIIDDGKAILEQIQRGEPMAAPRTAPEQPKAPEVGQAPQPDTQAAPVVPEGAVPLETLYDAPAQEAEPTPAPSFPTPTKSPDREIQAIRNFAKNAEGAGLTDQSIARMKELERDALRNGATPEQIENAFSGRMTTEVAEVAEEDTPAPSDAQTSRTVVLDEVEGVGSDAVETGRKIEVDLESGEARVVETSPNAEPDTAPTEGASLPEPDAATQGTENTEPQSSPTETPLGDTSAAETFWASRTTAERARFISEALPDTKPQERLKISGRDFGDLGLEVQAELVKARPVAAEASAPTPTKAKDGSWFAIRRSDGEVIGEFQTEKAAGRIDPAKVALVPAREYLGRLNNHIKNKGPEATKDTAFFKAMAKDFPAPTTFKEQRAPSPESKSADKGASTANLNDVMSALRKQLDKAMLKQVSLDFDPKMKSQAAFTSDAEGNMRILIGASLDPEASLRHEAIHALRAANLFTPKEWSALTKEANAIWMKRFDIAERYPDLTPEQQIEEAIAEGYGAFKGRATNNLLKSAFAKIKRFFKAMGEALTGLNLTSVEDVFDDVTEGRVGARAEGVEAQGVKEQRQPAVTRGPGPLLGDPIHIPDRGVWDELTSENRGVWERLKGGAGAAHDALDRARFRIQDRFLPVLRAQQAIERASGEQLPEYLNAYLTEETFSGKAGMRLDDIDAQYTQPIIEIIANTKGLTADTVGDWLTARHAKERNARIAKIAKDMPDGGAGMKNAEADRILQEADASNHKDALEEIGSLISQLRKETLDLRVDSGLLTKEDADTLRSMYEHYVPLKGFAETDNAEASLDITGVGSKYSIRGAETQRALGRKSRSFNPLMGAIVQAQEVAIRAEKNRVGQSVYQLAKEYPSEAMWEIKAVKEKRFYNSTTGMVETRAANPIEGRLEPNEMSVKVDGKEKRIVFHDPRLAESLGSVGADQVHGAIAWAAAFNRYLSMMITTLDPEFMIRNAFRDVTAAEINVGALAGNPKDKRAIRKSMLKNWPKAWAAIEGGMRGKVDSEWQKYYREFQEAGAKVHFFTLENPEAGLKDFERRINFRRGPLAVRALKVMTSPSALLSVRDNPVLGFVERMNLATENAVRLSAFVEARKNGWTQAKAASLAKNLTVNFNRRGTETGWINGLFLFFNAAIQGLHVTARTMASKRGVKVMGTLMLYGFLKELLNASLSEEDEDGILAYDKIPDHKRAMNDIWMVNGEDAVMIPLPYIFAVFPYAGQQAARVMRGQTTKAEATGDVFAVALQQTSPIGLTEGFGGYLPTMARLPYEMSINEDWLGRPIRPPSHYNDYGPNAYKFYPSVTEASREVANFLNRTTGGNASESGLVDLSPEYIDHTFSFLTGGAGRFVGRTVDMGYKLATGQEVEARDIPIARQVSYKTEIFLDRSRFYDNTNAIREANAQKKMSIAAGEPVPERVDELSKLYKLANRSRKRISVLNKKIQSIRDDKALTPDQRKNQIKLVEKQQAKFYDEINGKVSEIDKELLNL